MRRAAGHSPHREARPGLRLVTFSHDGCGGGTTGLMAALAHVGVAGVGSNLVAEEHMGLVAFEARGRVRCVHSKASGRRKHPDQARYGTSQRAKPQFSREGRRVGQKHRFVLRVLQRTALHGLQMIREVSYCISKVNPKNDHFSS